MKQNHGSGQLYCYCSFDTMAEIEEQLDKQHFWILGNSVFTPGVFTEFNGYFSRPLWYAGSIENTLYFFVGEEKGRFYYEYFHYIDTNRFCINTCKGQSCRDFNYINGLWDWQKITAKKRKSLKGN